MTEPLKIPADLAHDLRKGCEIPTVYGTFHRRKLQDIKIPVFVPSHSTEKFLTPDVNQVREGLYCTTAISPLIAPDAPDIDGDPVWIPALERYAVWTEIYHELHIYPENTTWTDIRSNIIYYTCSAAVSDDHMTNVLKLPEFLNRIDFIPNDLLTLIEKLEMQESGEDMLIKTSIHLETILEQYPFSPELLDFYGVLCELYQKIGFIKKRKLKSPANLMDTQEVIDWYQKCVPIIKSYIKYDLILPQSVITSLLILSLWLVDIDNYSSAIYYIKMYQKYSPETDEAYQELKNLIAAKKNNSTHHKNDPAQNIITTKAR